MTAAQYAIYGWNERALIPTDNYQDYWNVCEYRRFRNALYDAYNNNNVYGSINTFSTAHKNARGMYKFSRPVYNPANRLVNSYPTKVYGGNIDFEDLSTGPIPITGVANDRIVPALLEGYKRSNWQEQKNLYVLFGALYGDSFIKIVDEPDNRRARQEALHPGKVKDIKKDTVGNLTWIHIEYMRSDDNGKSWYRYGEIIDEDSFMTLKDDKEYAYVDDENGKRTSKWRNLYEFVPVVHVKHQDAGQLFGVNSFHAQMPKIDELNDAASLLNDQIRKSVNLIWYFAGVSKRSDLPASTEEKDEVPAIYGPKESQPFPMVGNLDLTSAGQNIERLIMELERDTPELALHRLREGGNLTAPGVRASYADAIDKFTAAQGVYDGGLVRANKMLMAIAGERGYDGFEAFNLDSYDKGDLEHYIKQRPIVADELSKLEKTSALQAMGAPIWLQLKELDYDQETIDKVTAEKEQEKADAMRALGQEAFGDEDEDDGETTDTEEETNASASIAA